MSAPRRFRAFRRQHRSARRNRADELRVIHAARNQTPAPSLHAGVRRAERCRSPHHRRARRHRTGTRPRRRRDTPRAALFARASRLHTTRIPHHADDRERARGVMPLPADHARTRSAVRSSCQPIVGVPRDVPMRWASDSHRRVPAIYSDGATACGTSRSSTIASNSANSARARCATLRYFSLDQPCSRQNSAHPIPPGSWLARTRR